MARILVAKPDLAIFERGTYVPPIPTGEGGGGGQGGSGQGGGGGGGGAAGGAALARTAGEVRAMAKGSVRFWEWLPPFLFLARRPRLRRLARAHVDRLLERGFGKAGPEREAADLAAKEGQRAVETLHRTAVTDDAHRGGLGVFAIQNALAAHGRHGLSADETAVPGGVAAIDAGEIAKLGQHEASASRARDRSRASQQRARSEKLIGGGLEALAQRAAVEAKRSAASGDVADLLRGVAI